MLRISCVWIYIFVYELLQKYTWRKESFEDLLSNLQWIKCFWNIRNYIESSFFYAEQPISNHTACDATAFISGNIYFYQGKALFALQETQCKIIWSVHLPVLNTNSCFSSKLFPPIWCSNVTLLESLHPRLQEIASQGDRHLQKDIHM